MKTTKIDAASVLFPALYRRQVLSLLFLNPDRKLHVREIARLTGTTAGTLNKELARLYETGLLERERVGNQLRYWANRSHQIYPELAAILRKTVGLATVLLEALAPLAKKIRVAFVFGSIARGSESVGSDIDVMIIGSLSFGATVDALFPVQERLGREINPKVFSVSEWNAKLVRKDAFVTQVLADPKIFLIGSEDELAELGLSLSITGLPPSEQRRSPIRASAAAPRRF